MHLGSPTTKQLSTTDSHGKTLGQAREICRSIVARLERDGLALFYSGVVFDVYEFRRVYGITLDGKTILALK
jgi:hypothetical protein